MQCAMTRESASLEFRRARVQQQRKMTSRMTSWMTRWMTSCQSDRTFDFFHLYVAWKSWTLFVRIAFNCFQKILLLFPKHCLSIINTGIVGSYVDSGSKNNDDLVSCGRCLRLHIWSKFMKLSPMQCFLRNSRFHYDFIICQFFISIESPNCLFSLPNDGSCPSA